MEKIKKLKKFFNHYNIDGFLVSKNDEHFNGNIKDSKNQLKFISNFSGSFGYALILKKKNYLFVDGRYSLQAKLQSGKNFKIITIPDKLPFQELRGKKLQIGFDPKLHTHKELKTIFFKTCCKLLPVENIIKKVWRSYEIENNNKFYHLPQNAIGQSHKIKIEKVIKFLKKRKIDLQFVTSSENIAWLLNIRGNDSKFVPIPNSYLVIDKNKKIILFCDLKKIDKKFQRKFKKIRFQNILNTQKFLEKIRYKNISIDRTTCSFYFENILLKNNKINNFSDSIYQLKSIKSKKEIKNVIQSHIEDGAALTKFLFWLKRNFLKKKINEIDAQNKLLSFRKKNKNFKFPSFPTISGSGPNGAIIHYNATEKTNRRLKKGDIYLVDSGGQYAFGTTDVTRTISLNNNNERIKKIFTTVLKGHIAVAKFSLKKNTCGSEIDRAARKPLQKINLNYAHGTGHGVGYFLNVHEGPYAISIKNNLKIKDGLILSNEPGYYETGKFGIRIENLIYTKKSVGGLKFENLTMVPLDKSLIIKNILKQSEIDWINKYHKKVFKSLKKFMNVSELKDLTKACSII